MRPEDRQPEESLDKLFEEIRNDEPGPAVVEKAAQRVWVSVSREVEAAQGEAIRGCAGFRALLPAYRAGELPGARMLLVRDHLHECVGCRKEFMKQPAVAAGAPGRSAPRWRYARWAVAAAVSVVAALAGWELFNRYGPPPAGPAATVHAVSGTLYALKSGEMTPVTAGAALAAGDEVRAARGAWAVVRLRDGSLVEMRERSAFSLSETRRDVTIRLARGSVIVEAAPRSAGRLYVAARECRAAVTGTIFGVSSGVKGDRVAVVEGEVHVAQGGRDHVLRPGQEYSSNPRMTAIGVAEEVAWSRNSEEYVALLKELAALGQEMEREVRLPEVRYASRLVGRLPRQTALYMAFPNMGETLAEANRVFQARIGQSPVLRGWWEKQPPGTAARVEEMVESLGRFGSFLGDEIVVTASLGPEGKMGTPCLVAEVRQTGLEEFVKTEMARHGEGGVRFFTAAAAIVPPPGRGLSFYLNGGVVAVSPDAEALRRVAAAVEAGGGGFSGTGFHDRIVEAYSGGAGLLFCADLQRLAVGEKDAALLGNVQYLMISQKASDGPPDTRATMTFAGRRTGIFSWLAAPAPIGALDFVSPEAPIAWAFAIEQPAVVLDSLAATVPNLAENLAKADAELGFKVRDDLAAAFGSEFVVALDGPAFPVPSWKLVAEVYNQAKLQYVVERIVEAAAREASAHGKQPLRLKQEQAGGRTWYTIVAPDSRPFTEFHYTFADGYLIAAPSRALVEQAIGNRAAGNMLAASASFRALMPEDGQNHFSALVYYDVKSTVEPLAEVLSEEQRRNIEGLEGLLEPTLVLGYGAADRITVASTAKALGFTPGNLFGLRAPLGVAGLAPSLRPAGEAKQ